MRFVFALSFLQRLRGLLARKPSWLGENGVLVIAPCNSIHTFGMKYAIDVAFLDKNGMVLLAKKNLAPKKRLFCKNAVCVLERISLPKQTHTFANEQNAVEHSRIFASTHDSEECTSLFVNGQNLLKRQHMSINTQSLLKRTRILDSAQEKIIPWFSAGDYCELAISRKND